MRVCNGKICLDVEEYEQLLNALIDSIQLERALIFETEPEKTTVTIKFRDGEGMRDVEKSPA